MWSESWLAWVAKKRQKQKSKVEATKTEASLATLSENIAVQLVELIQEFKIQSVTVEVQVITHRMDLANWLMGYPLQLSGTVARIHAALLVGPWTWTHQGCAIENIVMCQSRGLVTMPSVDHAVQGDKSLAQQLVHITFKRPEDLGFEAHPGRLCLAKKVKIEPMDISNARAKQRISFKGPSGGSQDTMWNAALRDQRHPLAVPSRDKLLNHPAESGPANSRGHFALPQVRRMASCLPVYPWHIYLGFIQKCLSLRKYVNCHPLAQLGLPLPTAAFDKIQYLHFSLALKCSRLNRGNLNMEQSSRLALQKEPGPRPGRVPRPVTFESVRGIRSIYKLGLAIVNNSERSQGSAACSVGDDTCDTSLRCCGMNCGRKAGKYFLW